MYSIAVPSIPTDVSIDVRVVVRWMLMTRHDGNGDDDVTTTTTMTITMVTTMKGYDDDDSQKVSFLKSQKV